MKLIEIIITILFTSILVLFGVGMAFIAPEEHRIGYYTFSLFCFSFIGAWCTKGRLFNFLFSIIAAIVLITVIYSISYKPIKDIKDMFNATIWLLLFGYPSIRVILKLKFGLVEKKIENEQIEENPKLLEKEKNESV